MTWDELVTLISGAGPAHLATADPNGAPHVAVAGVGVEGDVLWFATRRTSGKAQNLATNPRVALVWQGNAAETYLWGDAEVLDDDATRERIWTSGILPYDPAQFFGAWDNPLLVLVRVSPTRATAMVAGAGGLERRRWSAGG